MTQTKVGQRLLVHLVGMAGQIASGLPVILITLIIARTDGLEAAGKFSVAVGLSAAVFTTALWGFGSHIVLDRFKDYRPSQYLLARTLTTLAAAAATLIASGAAGIAVLVTLCIVVLRIGDAMIDLSFAFDQVGRGVPYAMKSFAAQQFGKIGILLLFAVPALLLHKSSSMPEILASGGIVCAGVGYWLWRETPRDTHPTGAHGLPSLFFGSRWLALAMVASTVMASFPRIVIAWLYHGPWLGVAGISLSIMAFLGMTLYTAWLRHQGEFGVTANKFTVARTFGAEVAIIAALGALASYLIFPQIVGLVFGFHGEGQIALCRDILVAGSFFSGSMSLANLYKATTVRWMESVVYVLSVIVVALIAVIFASAHSLPTLLILAGAAMLVLSLPAFWLLRKESIVKNSDDKTVIFVRLASRPVPRVIRMMRVALENGREAIFWGALREPGLLLEDTWQGLRVRRIGKPYPLLNGTKPFLYLFGVFNFNIALFRELRKSGTRLVHASDFEAMPGSIAYKWLYGCRLIYNIHDNVAQRYPMPRVAEVLINTVEGLYVLASDVTLVPEVFRRTSLPRWCRAKVSIVRNGPEDPGFTPPQFDEAGTLRIFWGGWMDWGRGLRGLLKLIEQNPGIELRVAGEGENSIVDVLRNHPHVTFLDYIENTAAIAETKKCHFVTALYDPSRIINRFAASNKLAEALAVGRPVLINKEMEISKDFVGNPGVIAIPYDEIANAGPILFSLFHDRDAYLQACAAARKAYEEGYAWSEVRRGIQAALFPGE